MIYKFVTVDQLFGERLLERILVSEVVLYEQLVHIALFEVLDE